MAAGRRLDGGITIEPVRRIGYLQYRQVGPVLCAVLKPFLFGTPRLFLFVASPDRGGPGPVCVDLTAGRFHGRPSAASGSWAGPLIAGGIFSLLHGVLRAVSPAMLWHARARWQPPIAGSW